MISGPTYLARGFGLWRRRPGLMLLGMVPAAIVFTVLATLVVVLVLHAGALAAWLTPFADDWSDGVQGLFRGLVGLLLVVAALAGAVLSFTGLTLVVGEPFYERIWRATEEMLGGPVPASDLGLGRAVRDGLALVLLGLATAVGVLVLGFVPLIGSVAGLVIGFVVAGRALAGELLSRPLEARGLDRRARAALLRPHRGRVLGFGAATQLFFLIPLGAIAVMPAAVAGATMLARDLLDTGDAAGATGVAGPVPPVGGG